MPELSGHPAAQQAGVDQLVAVRIVQLTLDSITEILATEGHLELCDFGVFEVRVTKPRKARNPRTGAGLMVPAERRVAFKTG